ncbi:MAG: hypothetical protein EBT04_11950 [Betaproteobacteria bacterium]|nr:hypothetical protein [Betaproteobacteria bacterium]
MRESMQKARSALALHPKCGARCRSGMPCKNSAMRNGRCRMHGGKSTGPRIKHGRRTKEATRTRQEDRELFQNLNRMTNDAQVVPRPD